MMEILTLVGIPLLIVALLSLLGVTWQIETGDPVELEEDQDRRNPIGKESALCIQRIFSPEDREFVEREGLPRLQRIYRAERTGVAVYWVRRISREARRIMKEHRTAARESPDLQVGRELGLIIKYLEFQALCGLLIFFIRSFGPDAFSTMAARAFEMSQALGHALESSTAAHGIAPAGNPGGV